MGFGVFVILKPADFSFAENVSCRLFSGQFIQVCLWQTCSEQKTGLNLQNQVLLFAPPLDPLSPSRPAKGLCPLESQERFYASLPVANLERTVDQTISVEPSLSRPPSPKNPQSGQRRGGGLRCFYARLRCKRGRVSRLARRKQVHPSEGSKFLRAKEASSLARRK